MYPMEPIHWTMSIEEDTYVEQLLKDIAFAEREIEERERYGEDALDESDIDIVITDDTTYITRSRIPGMEAA